MAKGDLAIVMDADLQDSPYEIPKFLDSWQQGNKIVVSIRSSATGSLFRRMASYFVRKKCSLYTRLPNKFYYGSFSLLTREVIDSYLVQPDRFHYYLKVLDRLPFEVGFVKYSQVDPDQVRSSYSVAKLIRLFGMLLSTSILQKLSNGFSILAVVCSFAVIMAALAVSSSGTSLLFLVYSLMGLTVFAYLGAFAFGTLLKLKTSAPIISGTEVQSTLNMEEQEVLSKVGHR